MAFHLRDLPDDKWAPVDADPPQIPKSYKSIASGSMPCSVQNFYLHVLSGQTDYFLNAHSKAGCQKSVTVTPWKPSGSSNLDDNSVLKPLDMEVFDWVLETSGGGGFVRTMSFVQPRKPPSPVDAQCVQRQQYCVYAGDVLVFATTMNMLNIPFRECFTINSIWVVKPEAADGSTCNITIHFKVHFTKSCLVAGLIRTSATRDTSQFYKGFILDTAFHVEAMMAPDAPSIGFNRRKSLMLPEEGHGPAPLSSSRAGHHPGRLPPFSTPTKPGGVPAGAADGKPTLSRRIKATIVFLLLIGIVLHQWVLYRQVVYLKGLLAEKG